MDRLLEVDGVLSAALAELLVVHAEREGWFRSPMIRPDAGGAPAFVVDDVAKARRDHRLTEPALVGAVGRRFVECLLPRVHAHFGFTPAAHESFKIVRYDAGSGWFAAHRDNVTPDAGHRRLAVTLNLDDGYEGGELSFPERSGVSYRPGVGAAVVFPCDWLHEVRPVSAGSRRALITFLW